MCIATGQKLKLPGTTVFLSLKIILVLANSVDPDEIMQHFIWVFTVCQSMHLGVNSIQRVKFKHTSELEVLLKVYDRLMYVQDQ